MTHSFPTRRSSDLLESGSAGNRADTGTGLRASSGAKPSAKNAGRRVAGLISLTGGQDGQASHVSWFVGKAGGAAGNANQWTGRDRPGGTLDDILQSWDHHARTPSGAYPRDRKSVVSGKSVSVRVDLGGRRIIKTKKQHKT